MKPNAVVSTKGRITIPFEVRKKYDIKPGDKVEFKVVNGAIRVKPLK